jgi:hypothetical protein
MRRTEMESGAVVCCGTFDNTTHVAKNPADIPAKPSKARSSMFVQFMIKHL